jgi:hypothetical protein
MSGWRNRFSIFSRTNLTSGLISIKLVRHFVVPINGLEILDHQNYIVSVCTTNQVGD